QDEHENETIAQQAEQAVEIKAEKWTRQDHLTYRVRPRILLHLSHSFVSAQSSLQSPNHHKPSLLGVQYKPSPLARLQWAFFGDIFRPPERASREGVASESGAETTTFVPSERRLETKRSQKSGISSVGSTR